MDLRQITVRLSSDAFERIDRIATEERRSRSQVVDMLIEEGLAGRNSPKVPRSSRKVAEVTVSKGQSAVEALKAPRSVPEATPTPGRASSFVPHPSEGDRPFRPTPGKPSFCPHVNGRMGFVCPNCSTLPLYSHLTLWVELA